MTDPQDPYASPDPNEPTPPGYGTPPPPPGYGPPPPGYGTPPPGYGEPQYGAPSPYGGAMPELASWGLRVQSALVDWFVPFAVAAVVQRSSPGLGALLWLAALGWALYNAYLQGTTGQSTGKKLAGTRLVRAADGQLVGAGTAIGRAFLHVLDGLPCYLGYLWPLWDAKKQTFADKIVNTVVVKA